MNKLYITRALVVGCWFFLFGAVSPAEAAREAQLRFVPAQIKLETGSAKTVQIWLEGSEKQLIGVDLVVKYNPELINVVDIGSEGVFSGVNGRKIDNKTGLAQLSLSNEYGVYSKGNKAIGWIKMKSLNGGVNTDMSIVFTPGSTTDTNVVTLHGEDVLAEVGSLTISPNAPANPKWVVLGESGSSKPETIATPVKEKNWEIIWLAAAGGTVFLGVGLYVASKNRKMYSS